ncbi:hypothetical protein ACOMHN_010864 [Nucella lapillus]
MKGHHQCRLFLSVVPVVSTVCVLDPVLIERALNEERGPAGDRPLNGRRRKGPCRGPELCDGGRRKTGGTEAQAL